MKTEIDVTRVNGARYIARYAFSDYVSAKKVVDLFNKNATDTFAEIIKTENEIELPSITFDGSTIIINGEEISDEVFNEELVDYKPVSRENLIDDLKNWICEAKGSEAVAMEEHLDYLSALDDSYLFSSVSTNEYISKNAEPLKFRDICFDIIEANRELNNEENREDMM